VPVANVVLPFPCGALTVVSGDVGRWVTAVSRDVDAFLGSEKIPNPNEIKKFVTDTSYFESH
jgi:hypothetical protein